LARPIKDGVDYFPLDVHLDDKFKFIEIKFKLEGFAILIKLFQKIYSYGYWYKWTEDEMLIFADENRVDVSTVKNVVDEAIIREIFDKELYEKCNILTSKGIQNRYKEIVKRRKNVNVIEEYLLIDNNFGINDNIMQTSSEQEGNTEQTPSEHNDSKSTQSKVKESKVKNINNIYTIFDSYSDNADLRQALRDYSQMRNKIKAPLTERAVTLLLNKLDALASTDDLKIKLLEQAIMSNWKSVYLLKEEKQQQKQKPNKFHNFIQNDKQDLDVLAEQRRQQIFEKLKNKEK
jgi:hypothetical protein